MKKGFNYAIMSGNMLEYLAVREDLGARAELQRRKDQTEPAKKPENKYTRMTTRELHAADARGERGARREFFRRLDYMPSLHDASIQKKRSNPAPAAPSTVRMTKKGVPHKIQKGAKKIEREAAWSPKRRAHVERSRRVMSYARDLMQQLGWYPGEAIRVAWSDEKAGKLSGYTPRDRAPVPEGLFEAVRIKNNPFGYDF